jgi:histidyl-tRNA synthetase
LAKGRDEVEAATMTIPTEATASARRAGTRPVERVRGTHDRSPDEVRRLNALVDRLVGNVGAHGYEVVDTPVIEHTELFLRKSGGERVAQLYAFQHRGRELALRPEFTASAVRYYVEHLQAKPLPSRLAFGGPVFRYEKPQAGRSRQFNEFGCELIGAAGLLADVEVISLALSGLRLAGIERPQLVLGHIGVVVEFLSGLNIDQRAQDWLTWSMERLRKGDEDAHELPPYLDRERDAADLDLPLAAAELDQATFTSLLRDIGVNIDSGVRAPEEIIAGLIAKRRRRHDPEVLRDAAEFVGRLTELRGPPDAVLQPLRELIVSRGLDEGPLGELEQVVELLEATGHPRERVAIDLGMGRGLHYYTGMLFEIYGDGGAGPQLCGGGRYDDLAQVLGARQPVAACGFSYGLERVLNAARISIPPAPPKVLVVAGDSQSEAFQLADEFRQRGWIAALDVRGRNPSATRRSAERQGFALVATAARGRIELQRPADGSSWQVDAVPLTDEVVAL